MKFPNKVTTYKESIISKFPFVLAEIKNKDMNVLDLFNIVKKKMTINEFVDVLDCLFALSKIEINCEVLHYVERN